jgi:hypothetical protein
MKNSEKFLAEMRKLNPRIAEGDYEEAHTFAMSRVPLVDEMVWLGEIGEGVYYANSREARWYPQLTAREVSHLLAEEII